MCPDARFVNKFPVSLVDTLVDVAALSAELTTDAVGTLPCCALEDTSCVPDIKICGDDNATGICRVSGDIAIFGNGLVWLGVESDVSADSAARGDGMGSKLDGVRGVVRPLRA